MCAVHDGAPSRGGMCTLPVLVLPTTSPTHHPSTNTTRADGVPSRRLGNHQAPTLTPSPNPNPSPCPSPNPTATPNPTPTPNPIPNPNQVPAKLAASVLPLRAILARRAEGVLLPPTQEKRAKPAMPVGLPPAMAAPRITPSTSPHARRSAAPPPGGPPLPPPRMASIQVPSSLSNPSPSPSPHPNPDPDPS